VNFGRRWRVPKLVLAIPGSAEFLARAPGVWQKRAAIIKANPPPSPPHFPRLASPCPIPSRPVPLHLATKLCRAAPLLTSPHVPLSIPLLPAPLPLLPSPRLASPCHHAAAARSLARSPVCSVPLRRVAAYPPPTLVARSLGIGKGRPRWRAQARGSNGKKSAGLTTGDGRRIDRANIGDRESAGVYGYNRERCSHDDGWGYTTARTRANDVPPNPGGLDYYDFQHYDENDSGSLSAPMTSRARGALADIPLLLSN